MCAGEGGSCGGSGRPGPAVPSDPAALPCPTRHGRSEGQFGASPRVALSPGGHSARCECRCRSSAVGAGRRKPLRRRKPRVNRLRAAPLRAALNSYPSTPSFSSFLKFFRRCQQWTRFPFFPEWGFSPTAGRCLVHFGGGNETTALSGAVRSFHSVLARETLSHGLTRGKKGEKLIEFIRFPTSLRDREKYSGKRH